MGGHLALYSFPNVTIICFVTQKSFNFASFFTKVTLTKFEIREFIGNNLLSSQDKNKIRIYSIFSIYHTELVVFKFELSHSPIFTPLPTKNAKSLVILNFYFLYTLYYLALVVSLFLVMIFILTNNLANHLE